MAENRINTCWSLLSVARGKRPNRAFCRKLGGVSLVSLSHLTRTVGTQNGSLPMLQNRCRHAVGIRKTSGLTPPRIAPVKSRHRRRGAGGLPDLDGFTLLTPFSCSTVWAAGCCRGQGLLGSYPRLRETAEAAYDSLADRADILHQHVREHMGHCWNEHVGQRAKEAAKSQCRTAERSLPFPPALMQALRTHA